MGDTLEFIFILLALFFFVLIYVAPLLLVVAVLAIVFRSIVNKIAAHGDPHDVYPTQWTCDVCDDTEDWHKHAP
jgi:hypothetical protein